jgi:hypothetical protein
MYPDTPLGSGSSRISNFIFWRVSLVSSSRIKLHTVKQDETTFQYLSHHFMWMDHLSSFSSMSGYLVLVTVGAHSAQSWSTWRWAFQNFIIHFPADDRVSWTFSLQKDIDASTTHCDVWFVLHVSPSLQYRSHRWSWCPHHCACALLSLCTSCALHTQYAEPPLMSGVHAISRIVMRFSPRFLAVLTCCYRQTSPSVPDQLQNMSIHKYTLCWGNALSSLWTHQCVCIPTPSSAFTHRNEPRSSGLLLCSHVCCFGEAESLCPSQV